MVPAKFLWTKTPLSKSNANALAVTSALPPVNRSADRPWKSATVVSMLALHGVVPLQGTNAEKKPLTGISVTLLQLSGEAHKGRFCTSHRTGNGCRSGRGVHRTELGDAQGNRERRRRRQEVKDKVRLPMPISLRGRLPLAE